jgi:hypothetical protein
VLFAHSVSADAAFAAIGEINDDIDLVGQVWRRRGVGLRLLVAGIVPSRNDGKSAITFAAPPCLTSTVDIAQGGR